MFWILFRLIFYFVVCLNFVEIVYCFLFSERFVFRLLIVWFVLYLVGFKGYCCYVDFFNVMFFEKYVIVI